MTHVDGPFVIVNVETLIHIQVGVDKASNDTVDGVVVNMFDSCIIEWDGGLIGYVTFDNGHWWILGNKIDCEVLVEALGRDEACREEG